MNDPTLLLQDVVNDAVSVTNALVDLILGASLMHVLAVVEMLLVKNAV